MKTVNDFKSLKNTKTTYNKVLHVAQKIRLTRTVEFTETGKMRDLTLEEREIISLCHSLNEAHKEPACVRRLQSDITFYVEIAKEYPAKC